MDSLSRFYNKWGQLVTQLVVVVFMAGVVWSQQQAGASRTDADAVLAKEFRAHFQQQSQMRDDLVDLKRLMDRQNESTQQLYREIAALVAEMRANRRGN